MLKSKIQVPNKNNKPHRKEAPQLVEGDFRNIIENLPVMYYAFDKNPPYHLFYMSCAFDSLGFSIEEWRNNQEIWIESIHKEDKVRVISEIGKAIKEVNDIDIEYRVIGKKKETYWVRNKGCAVKNEKGEIVCWQGIVIDITSQKNVEEELTKRKTLYHTIARNIPKTAVIVFDFNLRFTLAEGEQLEKMNFSPEMLEGKSIFEVFPKEISEEWSRYYYCALAGGFVGVELQFEGFIFRNYVLPLKNEKNEIYGGMSILHDITEEKQKNEKLQESEEKYREIFDGANDIIYVHDLNGNYLSLNKAGEKLFGYSQKEILKLKMQDVVVQEQLGTAAKMLQKKIGNPKTKQTVYELDCLTKTGSRITLEINSSLVFKDEIPIAVQGIARDITDRKIAQKRIQESEAELTALFGAMDDLVIVFDKDGRYLKITHTNPALLYKPAEELLGKKLHDFFPIEVADYLVKSIQKALKRHTSERVEYSVDIENKEHWFSAIISPMTKNSVVMVARDFTKRKLAEEALRLNEEKYRDLFENANDLIYTINLEGNFTSLNRAGERISGYTCEEALEGKINIAQIVAPEYLELVNQKLTEKLMGKKTPAYELEIIAKDGKRVSVEISTRVITRDGQPIGVQGIARDITDRKKTEAALKYSENKYRHLSEGIMHQVWTARPDGKIDYLNSRGLEYFGIPKEKLDEIWSEVFHPEDLAHTQERWTHALKTGEIHQVEFRLRRHDGEYRWHRSVATAGRDAEGNIIKWYGTNTDIHDQKTAEEQLNHIAKHDSLTNLPNRAKFMTHLERVVKRTEHLENFNFAVLFLDMDRFKVINDSLGHLVGDKLLIAFSERLESCVRPGDIVARLGGDEFTILLNDLSDTEDAMRVANRLIQMLTKPFKIDQYEVFTTVSIGIVVSDGVKRQPEDYLRDADTAMYRAKEAGKACYEVFNSEMHIRNLNLLQVENDLRRAIERNEFRVFYQPIVSLETGEICEFEALLRWQHPEKGLVFPDNFINVAEETGLIVPIGKWILEESCRQIVAWQNRFSASHNFRISVNLSARQLLHPNLISQVGEVIANEKLNPKYLHLEVTESVVMGNSEMSLEVLSSLKKLGVSLSTDDFGTGYSSLSYLHRFPFDRLKIDRSFIGQMDANLKSAEIVRSILTLAQNIQMDVVAEGIETEEQLYLLQLQGCKLGQGYFFSKPVDAKSVEKLLAQKNFGFSNFVPYIQSKDLIESAEVQ